MNKLKSNLGYLVAGITVLYLASGTSHAHVFEDSVIGNGSAGACDLFEIQAESGPAGEEPSGHVQFKCSIGDMTGVVRCLKAELLDGFQSAAVGGEILSSTISEAPAGSGFIVHVKDRSPGITQQPYADSIRLELISYVPSDCPSPELISPAAVSPNGNVKVHNDRPRPIHPS